MVYHECTKDPEHVGFHQCVCGAVLDQYIKENTSFTVKAIDKIQKSKRQHIYFKLIITQANGHREEREGVIYKPSIAQIEEGTVGIEDGIFFKFAGIYKNLKKED